MHLMAVCAAVLVNFALIIQAKAQCPRYELYYDSLLSPTCDVNCQDLRRLCPLSNQQTRPGCYCQPNYARNLRQQCIPRSQCSRDCLPNEKPIAPLGRDCENSCRLSPNDSRVNVCYRREERRCVCAAGHCRNRTGQCQWGF